MRMIATRPVRNMTIRKLLKMENQWICRALTYGVLAKKYRIVTGPDPTTPRYEVHQPVVLR
jgi:hypothetical protein